jgi:hypothetical protein
VSAFAANTAATRDLPDVMRGATIDRITFAPLSDGFAWIVPTGAAIS